jgi:hypothetical protein
MLLRDMVPDGERPDLLVDPAWRDIPHPANKPPKDLSDAVALRRPAPDRDDDSPGDDGQTIGEAFGFTNSFGSGS